MKKNLISIIVVLSVLAGLLWLAKPSSEDSTAQIKSGGALTVEEASSYDFGSISMTAGVVSHQFKIKNSSAESVTINKVYTSCMCTTANLSLGGRNFGPFGMPGHGAIPKIDQVIKPNEVAAVEVVFDPAAHGPAGVGKIERVVTLENNAGEPIELQFAAMVTP